MPESPELTALAEYVAARAGGQRLHALHVTALQAWKSVEHRAADAAGATLGGARRHGKFLAVGLDGSAAGPLHLVVHLARAGWLQWRDRPASLTAVPPRLGRGPLAARLVLSDAVIDLTEAGTQKRLSLYLVESPRLVPGIARLGPDPLEAGFTPAVLAAVLTSAGRTHLKGALSDQSRLAGIGNAYSDEICWAARLSPFTPAATVVPERVAELHSATVTTLADAVAAARLVLGRTGPAGLKERKRSGFSVHGRGGEACPRCRDTIRSVNFAERSLQYCPNCQTGGRLLADRRLSRLLR